MIVINNSYLRLVIVVVLYRMAERQSRTLSTLAGIAANQPLLSSSQLIIWDNSPGSFGERIEFSGFRNVRRIYTPENQSLSSIYNQCAEETSSMDALCIFDQDTKATPDYFVELQDVIHSKKDIQCFLPLVRADTTAKIVSPGCFGGIRGHYWETPLYGRISSSGILAIGSGMCIRSAYLHRQRPTFDERLTLYGVDSQFLIQFSKHEKILYILKSQLFHGHSAHENESWSMKWFRFRNWYVAWSIIHKENPLNWFRFQLYSGIRLSKMLFERLWPQKVK